MRRALHAVGAVVVATGVGLISVSGQAYGGATYTSQLTVERHAANGSSIGAPAGFVSSSAGEINCGNVCSTSFSTDGSTSLPVTAAAAYGWSFDHWEGCASVDGATCDPPADNAETVSAFFVDAQDPSVHIGEHVIGAWPASPRNSNFTMTAFVSDNDAVQSVRWYYAAPGSSNYPGVTDGSSPVAAPTGSVTHIFDVSMLSDGTYTFGADALDYSNH